MISTIFINYGKNHGLLTQIFINCAHGTIVFMSCIFLSRHAGVPR